jgi:DNA (cytosine-5)-methyltransferase 1
LLPPGLGGRPQIRERIFVCAVRDSGAPGGDGTTEAPVVDSKPVDGWDPTRWNLAFDLPLEDACDDPSTSLSAAETLWIDAWNEFVEGMRELRDGRRLPGFPLWGDHWVRVGELEIPSGTPKWKSDFLRKNADFYARHRAFIDTWAAKWGFYTDAFPPSRRKFEWQAQDAPRLWDTVMQMRPTGIRAKRATYLPALVAITQTSIIGPRRRKLSVREAARLQGLPESFSFGMQKASDSYRQLGNGVSVGAVYYVVRRAVSRYEELLKKTAPEFADAVLSSPPSPDVVPRV